MIKILILPEKLRAKLKKPFGVLIRGEFQDTVKIFKEILERKKPNKLIAVGDAVSEALLRNGVLPEVFIVDNRVMRKEIPPIKFETQKTIYVSNPAGTISDEAWKAVKDALNSSLQVKIVIDGEEDLLTLPAILFAPENSLVVYGQPREGMVVVHVTEAKRMEVKAIIEEMQASNSKD